MASKYLLGAVPITALQVVAAMAEPLVYTNDSGGSATFYGQATPAFINFDDGKNSYSAILDNANSNTRFGFNLDQDLQGANTLRFTFETSIGSPQTSAQSQYFDPVWAWDKGNLRKFEAVWSGDIGTIYAGQGSMATDGVAHADLTRTGIAGYVYRPDLIGSFFIREDSGDLSDIKYNQVFYDFDGGRRMRLRYDTPSFNGFFFAAAYGENILDDADDADYTDVALWYENTLGDIQLEARAGYAWKDNSGDMTENLLGSVSMLHEPTGLTAKFGAGSQTDNGSYGYGKLGWIGDFTTAGWTALSVDYYSGTDMGFSDSASDSWGLQAVQYFERINLEAYLAYSEYGYDDSAANYRDSSSTLAGVRWKF